MSEKKDPRWAKQFGDFGEQLVMYLIGRHKNMKVALVDHAGADLIASDLDHPENRYAISVKSHAVGVRTGEDGKIIMESKSFPFDDHNVKELSNFANGFKLEKVISMVIVQPVVDQTNRNWIERREKAAKDKKYFEPHEQLVVDVFTFLLEDAKKMMEEGKRYITKNKRVGGFNFNFENAYFEELTKDERIDHVRLRFDPFSDVREWDPQHPMDRNAVQQAATEES